VPDLTADVPSDIINESEETMSPTGVNASVSSGETSITPKEMVLKLMRAKWAPQKADPERRVDYLDV